MQIHVLLEGCRQHSVAHGQQLLGNIIFNQLYEAECASSAHGKRVLPKDLHLVRVVAPEVQSVRYDSLPTDKNWRSGLDNCPLPEFLESNLPRLFATELDKSGSRVNPIRILVTIV